MCVFKIITFTCLICLSIQQMNEWNGNVCSETVLKENVTTVCNCTTLGGLICCGYIDIIEHYNETTYFCCPGWTHLGDQNCSTPICTSTCLNGGVCVSPDTCACKAGYEGATCQTVSPCSHLQPCYPGDCSGNPKQCICSNSFSGSSCLTFDTYYVPTLLMANSTLKAVDTGTNTDLYSYSVNPLSPDNVTWSNQNDYSLLSFSIQASFNASIFGTTPKLPSYIHEVQFGIVAARVQFTYTSGSSGVPFGISYSCAGVSNNIPVQELNCYIPVPFGTSVGNGDVFTLQFTVTSGGWRQLQNTDYASLTEKEYYVGQSVQTSSEFKFDFVVPQHCIQNLSPCTNNPLDLAEDITTKSIKPYWSGWTDNLSGVYRYSFEVWKMEYSTSDNGLREPLITTSSNPEPLFITEIMASSLTFPEFTPSSPGVYSCILEVNDRANNSEYVRRIALYDPTSEITINSSKRLYISTANINTDYLWQTEYNADGITTISVVWEDLFTNNLHSEEHFLSKILPFEPRLSDNIERINYKRILPAYDDNEGEKTTSEIAHINGIVKFEMVNEIISKPKTEPPGYGWIQITPLAQTTSFQMASRTIGDGDSHQVWIRASDITGRNKTVSTVIYFDQTGPENYLTNIAYNIAGGEHQFTTRISIISQDIHSGVKNATFELVLNQTGELKYQTKATIMSQTASDCSKTPNCYCVPTGQCFTRTVSFDVNNCLLGVPLELLDEGKYSLRVMSLNKATLSTMTVFEIGAVTKFNGINIYPSPSALTVVNKTNTAVTIQWTNVITCYELLRYIFYLHKSANSTDMYTIEKNSTDFTISGLSPGTLYRIEMYSEYGSEMYTARSPVPLNVTFTTDQQPDSESTSNLIIILVPTIIILLLILIISIIVFRIWMKKRLRRLSTSPSGDVLINGSAKRPILNGTHTTLKTTTGILSVPDRPDKIDDSKQVDENVIFKLDLPKGRANVLAPISSRLQDISNK